MHLKARTVAMSRVSIALSLLATCLWCTATHAVTIRCDRALSVNGFDQIERQVFGLTAYEGPDFLEMPEGKGYFPQWGVESLGVAGSFEWLLPKDPKAMDPAAVDAWFKDPKGAMWFATKYPGPGTDRYVEGRLIPLMRAEGIEPFLYLVGNVPGGADANGVPSDAALWASFAAHYVDLIKGLAPKLKYVHVTNEPNAFWFRSNKDGQDYAKLFNAAAEAIHAQHPDVLVGGHVSCWPPTWPAKQTGQKDWYTWPSWSKPFLDASIKQLGFMDWHCYGVDAPSIEGEMHLVTGYARAKHGKWLRNAITETGFGLTEAEWHDRAIHYKKRALPMMAQFLTVLRNPDKVFCQQVHDFNAVSGEWYRWRPHGNMTVTPMMELYRILKPLRGTRLVVQGAPAEAMIEAATEGNRLAVALFNGTASAVKTPLDLKKLASGQVKRVTGQVLDVASLRDFPVAANGSVTVPGESLVVLTYELAVPLPVKTALTRREFFSEAVMAKIPADGKLKVAFPVDAGVQTNAEAAAIRLGFKGPAREMTWKLKIGGEEITLKQPGAFVEVPLARPPQGYPLELALQWQGTPDDDERDNYLSFASLVWDTTGASPPRPPSPSPNALRAPRD